MVSLVLTILGGVGGCDPSPGGGGGEGAGGTDGGTDGGGQDEILFQTDEGELRLSLDSQGRPSRVVRNALDADFSWGGSQVLISVTEAGAVSAQSRETSTSDAALIAALQQLQDSSGLDVGNAIAWLQDHPGGVNKSRLPSPLRIDTAPALRIPTRPAMQSQIDPRIEAHLDGLARPMAHVANLRNLVEAIVNDPNSGLTEEQRAPFNSLLDVLNDLVNLLHADFQDQQTACFNPCQLTCRVPCAAGGSGACCEESFEGGVTAFNCVEGPQSQCQGQFHPGFGCGEIECEPPGACCVLDGICEDVISETLCEFVAEQSGASIWSYTRNESCENLRAAGGCSRTSCCYGGDDRPLIDCDITGEECSALDGVRVEGNWCTEAIDPCD